MDDLGRLILKVFNILETPFFIVSYPDLHYVVSNRANNAELVSLLLKREIDDHELLGKTFDEIFSPSEAASTIRDVLTRAGSDNKILRLDDVPLTDPQGVVKLFNMVFMPLADEDGAIKYVVVTASDVSYRSKMSEQEKLILKAKEALRYKDSILSILNIIPYGVLFFSRDHLIRFANDSFLWITGYEREEIIGLHRDRAEEIFFRHEYDPDKLSGYGGTGSGTEINTYLITKYHDLKPVELFIIPMVKAGMVDGTVMLAREKTAELELARTKSTLRTVLDSVLSAVIITDRDQNIMACSKAGLEILGLEEDEVVGRSLQKVYDLLKVQSRNISFQTVKGKKYIHKTQATITTRDGKKKTLLFNNTPLFSRIGELTGMVLVGSDMTSFMEKQEKLIENERHAVIGQLTTGIAHEIKNPLTVISGFAEVTKSKILKINGNESLKESMLYYQQEIIENSRNMNRLIVDLLQLARPKRSEASKTNLHGTLEKICNTISPYALQKNVTLIKNLATADLEMVIDPVQIGQVLLNLCNNAIQAMQDGGTLGISTECSEGYLVIQVSDTGCGIKPEDMSKLGTPFFTTKSEGTGLGLSVTYSIIKDYGGKVEVESETGKGSTFKVYLPLNK